MIAVLFPSLMKYAAVLAITLALVPLLSRGATRIGLVDYPGRRKRHRGAIPLIGGPAVFAGSCLGAYLMPDALGAYAPLFAGLCVLLAAGLLDDMRDLKPWQKLLAQLIAATLMISWGKVVVTNLGDLVGMGPLTLLRWGLPFTIVALIGLINAVNLSDGADGLAAGLAMIALTFLAISAFLVGRVVSAHLLLTVLAAVLAFWFFNARLPWQAHARVFLGDSGSMMLGFLLTWFSIEVTRGASGLSPIAAVWFLAIPLLDMGVVIVRRLGRGHSPLRAGRDHFHHVLIATGMPPGTAVLVILALGLAFASFGFVAWRAAVPDYVMFYAFVVLFAASYGFSRHWVRIVRWLRRRSTGARGSALP